MWEQTSVSPETAEPRPLPLRSRCSLAVWLPHLIYVCVRSQVALLGIHPTVCFNFISSSLSIICDMPVRLYKLALWRAHRRSACPTHLSGGRVPGGREAAGINAELVQSSHLNADKVTFIGCLSSCSFEHSLAECFVSSPSLPFPSLPLDNVMMCLAYQICLVSSPGQGEWMSGRDWPAVSAYVNSPDKWRTNRGCLQRGHNCIITSLSSARAAVVVRVYASVVQSPVSTERDWQISI